MTPKYAIYNDFSDVILSKYTLTQAFDSNHYISRIYTSQIRSCAKIISSNWGTRSRIVYCDFTVTLTFLYVALIVCKSMFRMNGNIHYVFEADDNAIT